MRRPRLLAAALVSLLVGLGNAHAEPVIGISGTQFTINGTPKFLLLVSYFDAMRASDATLDEDFAFFRDNGIDGVRIFPNWWRCDPDPDHCSPNKYPDTVNAWDQYLYLRPGRIERLQFIVAKAGAYGLVVDVSMANETVYETRPPGTDWVDAATKNVSSALGAYRNVIIDIQNEDHILNNRTFSADKPTEADFIAQTKYYIHPRIPQEAYTRIAFVSTDESNMEFFANCGNATCPPVSRLDVAKMDVFAVHECRDSDGCTDWPMRTRTVVSNMLSIGSSRGPRPVYLQEPTPWQGDSYPSNRRAERFWIAANNAKVAGAAAWTFHTKSGHILRNASFKAQASLDNGYEKKAIEGLRARVNAATSPQAIYTMRLRTVQQGTYVVAEQGGNAAVHADRTTAAQWETFNLIDLNGDLLVSGDPVRIQTWNGYYLTPILGGGYGVSATVLANAAATTPGNPERVHIRKLDGGSAVIYGGEWVGFTCPANYWWMVAENGGGPASDVNWNRAPNAGLWETFQITLTP